MGVSRFRCVDTSDSVCIFSYSIVKGDKEKWVYISFHMRQSFRQIQVILRALVQARTWQYISFIPSVFREMINWSNAPVWIIGSLLMFLRIDRWQNSTGPMTM